MQAALAYAERGWAVFPCHHPLASGCSCGSTECASVAKHPRTRRGLHDATTHPEVIARWWRTWPQANVAIRTGALPGSSTRGVVVLDVDPPHGGDESLEHLLAANGRLPPTRMVHTGSGGRHLYFAHPGRSVRNSAGTRLGPGLDVRGDGGYVVAPPSIHATGTPYRWGPVRMLAAVPDWLVERLAAPKQPPRPAPDPSRLRRDAGVSSWAAAAVEGELARVSAAAVGQRNHVLNRASFVLGQIVGGGHLDRDLVTDLLEQAGQAAGLGAREAMATVESGLGAGEASPRHPTDRPPPTGHHRASSRLDQGPQAVRPDLPADCGPDLRSIELPRSHRLAPTDSPRVEQGHEAARTP